MEVTEAQKETLIKEFGEEKGNSLFSKLASKKGKSYLFNGDNTLMYSKEQTEYRILKTTPSKVSSVNASTITQALDKVFNEVGKEWNGVSYSDWEKISESAKDLYDEILEKKNSVLDAEIEELKKEAEETQKLLRELESKRSNKEVQQEEGTSTTENTEA